MRSSTLIQLKEHLWETLLFMLTELSFTVPKFFFSTVGGHDAWLTISFPRNASCCYCCCCFFFHQLNGTNVLIFIILQRMKATKCPSDEISLTNKVAVNPTDFPEDVEYDFFICKFSFRKLFEFSLEILMGVFFSNFSKTYSRVNRTWSTLCVLNHSNTRMPQKQCWLLAGTEKMGGHLRQSRHRRQIASLQSAKQNRILGHSHIGSGFLSQENVSLHEMKRLIFF